MIRTSVVMLYLISAWAQAQVSSTSVPSIEMPEKSVGTSQEKIEISKTLEKKYFIRMSYLTSRAGQANDYRNSKNAGSDDSGQMSENTTLPNMNYFSLGVLSVLSDSSQLNVAGLQSLDSSAARTIATPRGKPYVIPGEVFALSYSKNLSSGYSVDAREMYTDVYKFFDPSVGIVHKFEERLGWGHKVSMSLSAPVTEKSQSEKQLTRAFTRGALSFKGFRWSGSVNLSLGKTFYQSQPDQEPSSGVVKTQKTKSFPGPSPSPYNPDQIDLILLDRQDFRTATGASGAYLITDNLRYTLSTSLSRVYTLKGNEMWFSTAKPVGLAYSMDSWEIGSDFTLYSDIQDYKSPTWPHLWNVGFHLSHVFGNEKLRKF